MKSSASLLVVLVAHTHDEHCIATIMVYVRDD